MSQMENKAYTSILIRLIGEEVRDWQFSTEKTLIRFGNDRVEVADPRLSQIAAQITMHKEYWWIQVAGQTALKISSTGRASDLAPSSGSGLLSTEKPNIIGLNDYIFRIEFTNQPIKSAVIKPDLDLGNEEIASHPLPPLYINVKKAGEPHAQSYTFNQPTVLIGRETSADILLAGRLVSREHTKVFWNSTHYVIQDLGSSLGTHVNGQKLEGDHILDQSCEISLGPFILKIVLSHDHGESIAEAQVLSQLEQVSPQQRPPIRPMSDRPKDSAKQDQTPLQFASAQTQFSTKQNAEKPVTSERVSSNARSSETVVHSNEIEHLAKPLSRKQTSNKKEGRNTAIKVRQTMVSKRNVDLQWREPLDVFTWSNLKLSVIIGLGIALIWVCYWFTVGEMVKVGSLSATHSSAQFKELSDKTAHLKGSDCASCHTYDLPKINTDACLSCHNDLNTNSPFHSLHRQGQSAIQDCSQCHVEHRSQMVSLVDQARCVGCHPAEKPRDTSLASKDIEVRHDQLNQNRTLPNGVASQQSTLQVGLGIAKKSALIHAIHDGIEGQCIGCHASQDRSKAVDPSEQCSRCHSSISNTVIAQESSSSPLSSNHLMSGSCLSCHTFTNHLVNLLKIESEAKDVISALRVAKPKYEGLKEIGQKGKQTVKPDQTLNSNEETKGLISGLLASLSSLFILLWFASRNKLQSKREDGLTDKNIHESLLSEEARAKKLINIFDDACVGCGECVTACPYDVLALLKNKEQKTVAKVVNFDSCNECNDCVVVCKPQALTRRNEGEPLPMIEAPILDAQYMTNIHGIYLIGEASGTSLVRNANNLGSKVAQHIAHRGEIGGGVGGIVDVIIIGGGPAGVSAAIKANQLGLSYMLFEQGEERLNILATQYPRGKQIQNQPAHVTNIGPLPMDGWDVLTKEDFLKRCEKVMNRENLVIHLNHKVTGLDRLKEFADGQQIGQPRFAIHTSEGTVQARNTILAVGARGAPRQLGCPGEDNPMIQYHLTDPDVLSGQQIVVVGGGNSALEAAIAIGEVNQSKGYALPMVTLVYRGEVFKKASDRNQRLLKEAADKGLVSLQLSMNPAEVGDGYIQLKPSKTSSQPPARISAQVILCMIGSLPPSNWMKKMGVEYMERPQGWSPSASDDLSFLEL